MFQTVNEYSDPILGFQYFTAYLDIFLQAALLAAIIWFSRKQLKVTERQLRNTEKQLQSTEKQLQVTEKTADAAYKTLTLTHYSELQIDKPEILLPSPIRDHQNEIIGHKIYGKFEVSSNIPTRILDIAWTYNRSKYDPTEECEIEKGDMGYVSAVSVTPREKEPVEITVIAPTSSAGEIILSITYEDAPSMKLRRSEAKFIIAKRPDTEYEYDVAYLGIRSRDVNWKNPAAVPK